VTVAALSGVACGCEGRIAAAVLRARLQAWRGSATSKSADSGAGNVGGLLCAAARLDAARRAAAAADFRGAVRDGAASPALAGAKGASLDTSCMTNVACSLKASMVGRGVDSSLARNCVASLRTV
jgi:hypothetical protein